MLDSEFLWMMGEALLVGFFVVPILQTISLHGIQIALIKKHNLPMSGFRWRQMLPNLIRTYFGFLVNRKTRFIGCKLKEGDGGFEWRGTFRWKVW